MLILNNLSAVEQKVSLPEGAEDAKAITQMLGMSNIEAGQDGTLQVKLPPYGYAWLKIGP